MKKIYIVAIILLILGGVAFPFIYSYAHKYAERNIVYPTYHPLANETSSPVAVNPTSSNIPNVNVIPTVKIIPMRSHIFQTFNNCGPASLSMALSYFGITKSQAELGEALRPYQIKNGDNDDKSTSLDEMAVKAEEFGLLAYHRPNGTPELLKQFIALDMPVLTVTWLKPDDDIGHYRLVRGYDQTQKVFIQDDSFQGKNLTYTYDQFNLIWEKFSYEYLVLVPKDKQKLAELIIGDDLDEKVAWQHAVELSRKQLESDPNNVGYRFNLSVAYYHSGDYLQSVEEFEKVQSNLPFRTLWYQIEPIEAYYELGDYDKVLSISQSILNNHNRAFSELYLLRGRIYEKQGNRDLAKVEYEKAVLYNKNMRSAQQALASLK